MTSLTQHQTFDRLRRARRSVSRGSGIVAEEGVRGLARRVIRRAYRELDVESLNEPLLSRDVMDSGDLDLALPERAPDVGSPLTIGWVTAPPALGSGGHTTMFRMVEALEAAGHRCRLFLYDRYGGSITDHASTIREGWPRVRADAVDVQAGITGVDACFATSWDTAHVLARYGRAPMRRMYFIQDFEPYFYARGAEYALAEDSYRFGFRNVALGKMVGDVVTAEIGISCDVTEFGCDTAIYRPTDSAHRDGVVFYARPGVARRGYWLGRLALQQFHQSHPEVPIHVYGDEPKDLGFPAVRHGRLAPTELNDLYNRCAAGIAMSFTNISLVAEEMLAAGTIPVVNDSILARSDLSSEFVSWAAPTPKGIADALSAAVDSSDRDTRASSVSATARQRGWGPAQRDIVRIVEDEVFQR